MRRHRADRRQLTPDVRFNSELVQNLINVVLQRGKKRKAEHIVYSAMDILAKKIKDKEPLEVFMQALDNIKPQLELKSRRVGGANYQIPIEVDPVRQVGIGIRWLVTYSRQRKGKSMIDALSTEILDAYNNTGTTVKKKEETHKMAQANRAFAHYRW